MYNNAVEEHKDPNNGKNCRLDSELHALRNE